MVGENSFGGRRIMVVEDDYLIVADLVERLQAMGADVVGPIGNLDKAMERLDKVPGIVGAILDVDVQGEMVFPLADELSRRNLPYIFATGYDQSAVPERYAHVPRFTKPTDITALASALLEAVHLNSATHQRRSTP
ncbi:response regulator [uncultured Devosia sp.]|uniref:response regulator n=1 Tax=uncultured Devosia sp. TaxID=211434 RepID=UPI0035CC29CE